MLSLINLTDDEIRTSNASFKDMIEANKMVQMKLSNNGVDIDFSIENFNCALEFALGEQK